MHGGIFSELFFARKCIRRVRRFRVFIRYEIQTDKRNQSLCSDCIDFGFVFKNDRRHSNTVGLQAVLTRNTCIFSLLRLVVLL